MKTRRDSSYVSLIKLTSKHNDKRHDFGSPTAQDPINSFGMRKHTVCFVGSNKEGLDSSRTVGKKGEE